MRVAVHDRIVVPPDDVGVQGQGLGDGDGPGGPNDDESGQVGGDTGSIIWVGAAAVVVGTAVVLGGIASSWLRQAMLIRWSDLGIGQIPGGEDTVTLSDDGAGTNGMYTVTLDVPEWMTWWKAAELYDKDGFMRGTAFTQDNKKSSTMVVPASEIEGGFLVLKKAKFWGIHTAMYVIQDLPYTTGETPQLREKAGRALTLNWAAAWGENP
jgi:hypothetical protein